MQAATLTWDVSQGATSYLIYQSVGTGPFTMLQSVLGTTATVNPDPALDTRYYATAVNIVNGVPAESGPSNLVTNRPPPLNLSFEAELGVIASPFYISGGMVQQNVTTTAAADGGQARYVFNVSTNGNYTVTMAVNAPTDDANSLFVAVDADPGDNLIWDIPITSGVESRAMQWRGETNAHEFPLMTGKHELIIRGREAGTQIDRIVIGPVFVQPPPLTNAPPAPTNLKLTELGQRRRDFSWVSRLDASHVVEKSIESDAFQNVATLAPGIFHYIDTKARTKPTRYRVKACKVLCSNWSEISTQP